MPFKTLIAAALVVLTTLPALAAETRLSSPEPDMDSPRKIILQLTSKDPRAINNLLFNVVNIEKFYGMDNVRIAVIAYADGMQALYKKSSPVRDRILSLLQYDVQFVACARPPRSTAKNSPRASWPTSTRCAIRPA